MARIPDPVPGLVIRYGYVWLQDHRQRRGDPLKDRPACIIARVPGEPTSPRDGGSAIEPGDVIILPITTKPPASDVASVELTAADKRSCGLDPDCPSWVVVSEFNADRWPNADISAIPETGAFSYGIAHPGLLRRIGNTFSEARQARKVRGFKRTP